MKTLKWIIFLLAIVAAVFVREQIVKASIINEPRRVMLNAQDVLSSVPYNGVQASRFLAIVAGDYYFSLSNGLDYDYSTSSLQSTLNKVIKDEKINARSESNFILEKNYGIDTPKPLEVNSEQYRAELTEVVRATYNKNRADRENIQKWSGLDTKHGLEAVWQEELYNKVKKYHLSDSDYAYSQMILAQSVADAYKEAWSVKYRYASVYPSSYDERIVLSLVVPNYPSYVPEHAVVSSVASRVLAEMFPADAIYFESIAEASYISRMNAGLSIRHDLIKGKELGNAIGESIIANLVHKSTDTKVK